jgi:hypothetical protein
VRPVAKPLPLARARAARDHPDGVSSAVRTDRAKLVEILRKVSAELPSHVEKKMFGCEAFFTAGGIFAAR